MLEYRILGPLQVQRDGVEVVLTAPKIKAVLLVLLLRPNEVVSAHHLIDALWGDHPPESARKLVQVYVSQLRSALGADAIETVSHGYRIRVAPMELDAARFDRMRRDGRQALVDGNAELALALSRRALALWHGRALVEVADEPYAADEASRLEQLRLECTEDELDAELALGRHADVVGELHRLCVEHPLRERLRERLALALYRCARQSEALEVLAAGRKLLLDELGLEPGKGHQDLERAILNQDPALDGILGGATAGPARVPAPSSALIGREEELEQLSALLLREDVRIVTISGAGGSGKTRVALELARSLGQQFANGAAFVELASVHDPSLVSASIARALGVPETPESSPSAALADWLTSRDLLLVIDNFEHLVECADELARLVQIAPRMSLLVTSRRVLHISGEHVFPLTPLPVADAVTLFADRAGARDRSLVADTENLEVIASICRRLDCLPLAVELAAARSATLPPRLLLDRLSRHVAALGIGPRDAPARQQTLTDTLRWSTDLLNGEERRTLAWLSVFAGGCSIEAAETVCAADIEHLAALIDSSLLQRTGVGGEVGLSMLETVREHAAALLELEGSRATAETAHASYYLRLVESAAEGSATSQAKVLPRLDAELDNLRIAMDRCERAGDDETALRIATALYRYFYLRGLFREGRDRIRAPLDRGAGEPGLQALALRAVAGFHFLLGDLDAAEAAALAGIEVGSAAGASYPVMASHTVMSHVARERGDFDIARAHLERSEALAAELGLDADVIVANTNLGELALALGDLDEARRRWEHTMTRYGEDDVNATFALLGLGAVSHRQGRLEEASAHFARARDLSERAGWMHNTTMALVGLAGVAADQGEATEAAQLLGRASGLLAASGGELTHADEEVYQRARACALASLGEERLAVALADGERASQHRVGSGVIEDATQRT